jgi:phospholipid/cholesterol/gamma-HCH transport system substrate-binding protein
MIKISNETRIGMLAAAAIFLSIWGFLYLKGRNVLSTTRTFYVRYAEAGQLRPSSPVFISGFQVGTVKDMYIDDKDDKTIIAVLSISGSTDIPKNAVAEIVSASMMGGKNIEIRFNAPCEGNNCAQSGDYLQGNSLNFLQTMIGSPEALDAYVQKLKLGLISVYDTLTDPNDPQGMGKMLLNLDATVANLKLTTAAMSKLMAASSGNITATTGNLNAITANLRDNNAQIKSMLANADAFSAQLKAASIDKTTGKANTAIDSLTATISSLKKSLGTVDATIANLDGIITGVQNGNGTLGKLATDPLLYYNLERDTRQIALFMQDFRLNPKRYTRIHLLGKTKKYQNPIYDPAYFKMIDSIEKRLYQEQSLMKK